MRYEAVRFFPKRFMRRRPDGRGKWTWNLTGVPLRPCALERLVDHTPEVFVAEGEADCERLWSEAVPATTNIGGAGQWLDTYSEQLKTVAGVERAYLLPDHDVPGHRHAALVAASLHRVGIEVRIVCLPGLHDGAPPPAHGRDVSDWLETHTVAELRAVAAVAPRWTPTPEAEAARPAVGLDPALLDDVTVVVREGQQIARDGVPYVLEGLIPALGMVGVHVAYAKVGKTTFGQQLAGAVACGTPFLDRATRQARVLIVAAEDPPEYTAYLARHLTAVPTGRLTFYRHPIQLNATGLANLVATVQTGGYGLVLIASWQAVVATLIRDENDNAGSVQVMEEVKAATRTTGIPWLIDAHSGKGRTNAMRRTRHGHYGGVGRRRLRRLHPIAAVCRRTVRDEAALERQRAVRLGRADSHGVRPGHRHLQRAGGHQHRHDRVHLAADRRVRGADHNPAGDPSIAVRAGLAPDTKTVSGAVRRQVHGALHNRPGVRRITESHGRKSFTKYAREVASPDD